MLLQSGVDAVATVDGRPLGGFQTITGGHVSADAVVDRPPASRYPQSSADLPAVSNIIISRTWEESRDATHLAFLNARVSWPNTSSIGKPRRDKNGNQIGMTYFTGTLIRVHGVEGDSNSTGTKATLEMEFAISGGPSES